MTMDPSRCPRGYSSREIRDHVATRDLPAAAFSAKMALDRNAHVQLATGVLLGIGSGGIDARRAARIAVCFHELTTCAADRRRESAAHLLMSAMRAVLKADGNQPRRSMGSSLVNASGVDVTMAQPDPERAAAYAEAMCRTMPTIDVADRMAQACGRVTNLHGCSRDATALTAYSRCSLFAKQGAPAQTVIAAKHFLLACVRAAFERSPITDVASPDLIDALAATEKVVVATPSAKAAAKAARAQAPDDPFKQAGAARGDEDEDDDRIPTGTKMAALWTFVHKQPGGDAGVVHAADLQTSTEVRVIDGKGFISAPSASTLGRVHLVP